MSFLTFLSFGTSTCFDSEPLDPNIGTLPADLKVYHGITTSGTELPFGLCHLHLKAADKFPKRPFVSNIRQAITSFSELVPKRFEFDCVVVGSIQISGCTAPLGLV